MLTTFEYRCLKESVNVDLVQHVVDILMDENVFGTPLTMTANKIKKHQEKMKATPKAILKKDTCSPIEQCERDASEWQETRKSLTNKIPLYIRKILAKDLESCGGQDWYPFVMELGFGLEKRDSLRITAGLDITL